MGDKFDSIDGVYGVDKTEKGESWSMIFCAVFDMEQTAVDLISEILVYSPDDRLTALECLNHEYFDNIKSLMNKSKKNAKKSKKMKKENIVPSNLFNWNDEEMQYAKANKEQLRR